MAAVAAGFLYFMYMLGAIADSPAETKAFEIKTGDGFRRIVDDLQSEGLIRSTTAFKILSLATGSASKLKPGLYTLGPSMTSYQILNELILGSRREVAVTITEGENIYEIDKILSENGITKKGVFASVARERKLEGRLFPDTYKFFTDSDVNEVIGKFSANFELKTKTLLKREIENDVLVLASLLEKEVRDPEEQRIVAGILNKRLGAGIALQVDATICYIKVIMSPDHDASCYPLAPLDFKIDSPYNTYLYKGLPPGPIGNPGAVALESALSPVASPHLFYLSDPATGKTIFAKTFEEHVKNKVRYLHP